jgi:hypothetical protein
MSLLGTDAYRFALASSLRSARESLSVISAYVTIAGIEWILDRLDSSVLSCRVLARWNSKDLVSGASDLEVYDLVRRRGGRFFVLPDLHAKLVLVDNKQLFVGSANVTGLGLKLVPGGNREIGVTFDASAEDVSIVEVMFGEAIEVTPSLYDEFRENVEHLKQTASPAPDIHWPLEFARQLQTRTQRLWVTELFWCASPQTLIDPRMKESNEVLHDITVLGLDRDIVLDNDTIGQRFLASRPWMWLLARLLDDDQHELSFGRLSQILHDALIDDPKPYRQNVKQLVANLFKWVEEFGQPTAVVDRRNYSQRVRLVKQ